jgi:hypothetical protein
VVLYIRHRLADAGTATEQKPFSSNRVSLSGCEWLFVAVVIFSLFYFMPKLWERVEKFTPGLDYRLPYNLSNDYWLYKRYCRLACSQRKTLVIGDSVIWGHYVSKENTLSNYLNKAAGREMFANMGVDGIHPVALYGLLRYYGRDISKRDIILYFNLLWLSSKKHDLQIEKEFNFNHPGLVPQFIPNIPCYKGSYSKKLSAIMQRYVNFFSWISHLKIAYFQSMDLPMWSLEHPYENPLTVKPQLPQLAPAPDFGELSRAVKGTASAAGAEAKVQWVALESSLQWRFFQHSVEMLSKRGNKVFVLVGPFNEHILGGKSFDAYLKMKGNIEAWLKQNNVPYYMPAALPSGMYYDASHPTSQGYAELARQLLDNESFKKNVLH